MMKIFSVFILAIVMLLNAGCAHQSRATYVEERRDKCTDQWPESCILVVAQGQEGVSDEKLQAAWRRRVTELCSGPASASDEQIKTWIDQHRVVRDKQGVAVASDRLTVETVISDRTKTYEEPAWLLHRGEKPKASQITGILKETRGLVHCPSE